MHRLVLILGAVLPVTAAPAEVQIKYHLPGNGRVSIVIRNADGVVRELLHAAPRHAGANVDAWDGLDERGKPAAPGDYTWKLLLTQGLKARYIVTLGLNPTPRWDSWPGNHNGVTSVAVDADAMYLAGGCSEGPPGLIKQDFAGKRVWSAGHLYDAWQGGHGAAVAGGKLYQLQANGAIIVVEAATGRRAARWDVLWEKNDPVKDKDGYVRHMDIDAHGEEIVVAYKGHNAVRWLKPADGSVADEAAVPEPQAVAIDPHGQRVLVASKGRIVALTRAKKAPVTVAAGLTAPYRVDVEDATGEIYVYESGDSRQVKRLSRDGKLLKTYGAPGGRKDGPYDPMSFRTVHDITADQRGGFFICEGWTAPRRTARFAKDGKLLNDWYGGQMYANHGAVDPNDPTLVWVDSQFGDIMKCRIDYAARTWEVLATYRFAGLGDGFVRGTHHGGGRFRVLHHGGQTYLFRQDDDPCVLMLDEKQRKLVAKVASDFNVAHDWGQPWTPDLIRKLVNPDASDKNPGYQMRGVPPAHRWMEAYHWTDRSGDGKPQPAEIVWGGFRGWHMGRWFTGDDFNYYRLFNDTVEVMRFFGWTRHGAPIYGGWDAHEAIARWPKSVDYKRQHHTGRTVWVCPDGTIFACLNDTTRPFGAGFLSTEIGDNHVIKWNPGGGVAWVVGRHAATLGAGPGEARVFQRILGAPHGCVVVGDMQCYYEVKNLVHVWDPDGLWVGRMLESPDLDAAPESAYVLCTENFGGALYEVGADEKVPGLSAGDVVLFGSGQNGTPVYRVTGWDRFRRQSGTVSLSAEAAAKLTARVEAERRRPDLARIRAIPARGGGAVKVDADLAEWKGFPPLTITDGKTEVAKLYLGWNPDGIYAVFDVLKDRPWKSAASQREPFTSGAAVDLMIGPLSPARKTATAGDVRFVAAPIGKDGRTMLVEMLPRLAPGMPEKDRKPRTYKTGQGSVTFERVAPLPADRVAARPKKGGGYVVEFRVPLRAPLLYRPGQRFRFDASVILAAPAGNRSEGRLLWHSKASADQIVEADRYHEAVLRPANWGEAVLE